MSRFSKRHPTSRCTGCSWSPIQSKRQLESASTLETYDPSGLGLSRTGRVSRIAGPCRPRDPEPVSLSCPPCRPAHAGAAFPDLVRHPHDGDSSGIQGRGHPDTAAARDQCRQDPNARRRAWRALSRLIAYSCFSRARQTRQPQWPWRFTSPHQAAWRRRRTCIPDVRRSSAHDPRPIAFGDALATSGPLATSLSSHRFRSTPATGTRAHARRGILACHRFRDSAYPPTEGTALRARPPSCIGGQYEAVFRNAILAQRHRCCRR